MMAPSMIRLRMRTIFKYCFLFNFHLLHVVSSFSFTQRSIVQNSISSSLNAEENNEVGEDHLTRPSAASSIRVIYESDNILAIDKPAHISHHDDQQSFGVVSCVRLLQKEKAIEYQGRLWGVHRLDRVTSGILVFAKSNEVAHELSEAFREKKVTKYYVALTNKKPKKKKQGWVKGDMSPSRRKTWKLCNSHENPAITRFFTAGLGKCDFSNWKWAPIYDCRDIKENSQNLLPKTMILFQPHTGKTHQLRVAAKSLGMPILGDLDYSDNAEAKCMKRAYLHALAIHVKVKGENVAIYDSPKSWFHDDDEWNGLEGVLTTLMEKYCTCERLVNII